MWQVSHITFHVSGVMCQVSDIMFCMLSFTCHLSLSQQPQSFPSGVPTDLPLLTPPLCKLGWFAKTRKCLEVCLYQRYALQQEVSTPPGSGVSEIAHKNTQTHNSRTSQLGDLIGPVQWANSVKTKEEKNLVVCITL